MVFGKIGGTIPKNLAENLSELKPNLEILLITIVNLPLIAVDIIFMFLWLALGHTAHLFIEV